MRLAKVISGGQSGADLGALRIARAAGIPTGGWAPRGWWTEDPGRGGQMVNGRAILEPFGLVEAPEPADAGDVAECFRVRTRLNARDSDGTILFARGLTSPGAILTQNACAALPRPWKVVRPGILVEGRCQQAADWVIARGIRTLNVAGHRESAMPGIQAWVETFLMGMFAALDAVPEIEP